MMILLKVCEFFKIEPVEDAAFFKDDYDPSFISDDWDFIWEFDTDD